MRFPALAINGRPGDLESCQGNTSTDLEVRFNKSYLYPEGEISDWFQMSASDQDDENEDMSEDQIIAVRRGEPVSVTRYVTSSNDESDGPPTLLVRKNCVPIV